MTISCTSETSVAAENSPPQTLEPLYDPFSSVRLMYLKAAISRCFSYATLAAEEYAAGRFESAAQTHKRAEQSHAALLAFITDPGVESYLAGSGPELKAKLKDLECILADFKKI